MIRYQMLFRGRLVTLSMMYAKMEKSSSFVSDLGSCYDLLLIFCHPASFPITFLTLHVIIWKDELLQELAELEELELEEQALNAPSRVGPATSTVAAGAVPSGGTVFNLPSVPTAAIKVFSFLL